jgi:hypothetical protein
MALNEKRLSEENIPHLPLAGPLLRWQGGAIGRPYNAKNTSKDSEHYKQGKRSRSHLFPKEASDTDCAAALSAQAEQSKEHCEKQADVGDKGDDEVKLGTARVEYDASRQKIGPI